MEFYIDSANIEEIKMANRCGWVDGVTTNPTLVAQSGRSHYELIEEICCEVKGLVSAEVVGVSEEEMVKEGLQLAKIADNVVVKIPMKEEGLIAVRRLASEGIKTNVTLIFSPIQALMAAKAGATLVSPFVGRLDDIAADGMSVVDQIVQIYNNYDFETKVLVASARHPMHVLESALISAHIVTMPYKVMKGLTRHPLTDRGLAQFLEDARISHRIVK